MVAIKVKGLEYRYPDGTLALCGIDLEVFEEETIGLIGPNGAGKTTLILHFNGILRGKGEVEVMGLKVNDSSLKLIRSKVGVVFQDPDDQLFMPTVKDDIAFGPMNIGLDEVERRVREAMFIVGISGLAERVTHHLSLGEKKKVAIAGVLAMRPEILILDEPTANLDPRGRKSVLELFRKVNAKTKLVASHDLDFVRKTCSRVILMDAGRIVADGPADEILDARELLEEHGLI